MKNAIHTVKLKTTTIYDEAANGVIGGSRFSFNRSDLKFPQED